MPDAPELTRPPRRPSIKAVTIGIMLGLFSTFAYAWFLIPPDVVAEPVHLSRDADGTLVHDGNDAREDGTKLKAHFGALNARNNTVMSSSESHANPAFLAASRLAIYNESDHLLIARVATALLEQWKQDSPFNPTRGHRPTRTGPLPDTESADPRRIRPARTRSARRRGGELRIVFCLLELRLDRQPVTPHGCHAVQY